MSIANQLLNARKSTATHECPSCIKLKETLTSLTSALNDRGERIMDLEGAGNAMAAFIRHAQWYKLNGGKTVVDAWDHALSPVTTPTAP